MTDGPQYPQYPGEQPQQPVQPTQPPPPGYGAPPPPGYNPPPPPGYTPPPAPGQYPPPGYPPAPGAVAFERYASWWSRVGAALLDGLMTTIIFAVPLVGGLVLAFADADIDPVTDEITGGVNGIGILIAVLGFLVGIAFDIWNRVIRLGRTGQSLGKQAVGIKVASLNHGQPIGGGAAFGRWAVQFVPGFVPLIGGLFSLLDVLWPLWDDRNQAIHDKIVSSVVLPAR